MTAKAAARAGRQGGRYVLGRAGGGAEVQVAAGLRAQGGGVTLPCGGVRLGSSGGVREAGTGEMALRRRGG